MVFEDKRICFIHIPKCGGTSVSTAYLKILAKKEKPISRLTYAQKSWSAGLEAKTSRIIGRDNSRQTLYNMHASYDKYYPVYRDYKFITQVRNPITRFASIWKHLSSIDLVDTSFVKWVPRAIGALREGHWAKSLDNHEQYIQMLSCVNPMFDASLLLKHQFLYVAGGEVEVHKLEEGTIWEAAGLIKRHENNSAPIWKGEWTKENKILVRDYYERDFEKFGY